MENTGKGVSMTFIDLITEFEIVIPIVQRDYAHGRNESSAEQIRTGILTALHKAVTNGQSIELDYIYGSVSSGSKKFFPIDGQQRLTTLLLLHIYLSIKDNQFSELKESIKDKFTYEIRDTSREFLSLLCKHGFELSNVTTRLSDTIKNASWYHLMYTEDPSVDAMLRMLDSINDVFKDVKNGFSRLENGAVKFWVLTLQDFGLTDDLFIKMNSRGKRLSRYDNFKASFEEQIDKKDCDKEYQELIDEWEAKIDNEWLDFFWKHFYDVADKENVVEQSLFRHILFFSRLLRRVDKGIPYAEYQDLEEVDYSQDIAVLSEHKNLQFVIYTLDHLEEILSDKDAAELWEKAVSVSTEKFLYNERAFLFAKFYFGFVLGESASEYGENFWHVYKNLLAGQRETNARDKQYNSSIDAVRIGTFVSYTRMLIEAIKTQGDTYLVLSNEENTFGFSYYKYEVDKAKYIVNKLGVVDDQRKSAIWALEALPKFDGLIHNLLSNGEPIVNTQCVEAVQKANPVLLLRAIQSFSKEWIAEKTYHGQWKIVVCQGDEVSDHWYKYYSGFEESPANCGEYIMTVLPNKSSTGLSGAVKKFWEHIANNSTSASIEDELGKIIENNLEDLTFGCSYYFTKYTEFWGKPYSDCFVGLVSNKANLWSQMRVFDNRKAGRQAQIERDQHYNPFYFAVENAVKKIDPSITIQHSKGTDCKYIGELNFTLEIKNTGISIILKGSLTKLNWEIDLSKAKPEYKSKAKRTRSKVCSAHPNKAETMILECSGDDGIELIVRWIKDVVIEK